MIFEELKIKCNNPDCFNKSNFELMYEYKPDIDGAVYYDIRCSNCGCRFLEKKYETNKEATK